MKERIQRILRRLFFYSSRQLWRRWRTYLAVFFTSVFLLALVMCALELFQSFLINQRETDAQGSWHACFLDSPNNLEPRILKDSGVKEAWTVTWTSRLASSEDASAPGKLAVPDEETDRRFNIRYLWGHAPGEGEFAVSRQFYETYGWLEADALCDLWFKASEMTYHPLKLSGIYVANDRYLRYVFVSKETAAAIDRETGAHPKYDTYFTTGYVSDRYVAKIVDRLYRSFSLGPTDEQQPKEALKKWIYHYVKVYEDYINPAVLSPNAAEVIPSVIFSLPVIIVAALILASFMSHWTAANAPEFGVLGAIGATRRNLCSIAAGQVLLIALLSSPPVILFSALISRLYINAYNAATLGTGLVFYLPWGNFVKVSLWFAVLSCLFTYIGIARMTLEEPYILMTGSYRGEMPFVRTSSLVLSKIKDKVARLAVIETMRQIKGDAVQILVTAIVSVVVAVFAVALAAFLVVRTDALAMAVSNIPTDTRISATLKYNFRDKVMNSMTPIPERAADKLRNTPGIAFCAAFSSFDRWSVYHDMQDDGQDRWGGPCVETKDGWDFTTIAVADEDLLPYLTQSTLDGDPDALFTSDDTVLYVVNTPEDLERYPAGTTLSFAAGTLEHRSGKSPLGDTLEYTVAAVMTPKVGIIGGTDYFIFSREGGERLGLIPADQCKTLYVNYDPSLTDEEVTALLDGITSDPILMRYEITSVGAKNSSEKAIQRASMALVGVFCFILYLSFAVMSVTHVKMKTAQARRDISIKRQLGADEGEIYREMRIGTYPASVIAIGATFALALLFAILYILLQMASLNVMRDRFPFSYTPEVYAEARLTILLEAGLAILLSILSLPVMLFLAATAAAGTVPPTRAVLKEPITEGLRKGTD